MSPTPHPEFDISLRDTKKRRTRQHIVEVAEALFHERGFEAVTVAEVARVAEVGEQTVYNYFATKEGLVFDEADAFAERLTAMIRNARRDEKLADALRREVRDFLEALARREASPRRRGGMPYLIATSSVVRRGWLILVERLSRLAADAIVARSEGQIHPATAAVLGWAIVSVFVVIMDAVGEAARTETDTSDVVVRLRPQIEAAIDCLDQGLGTGGP